MQINFSAVNAHIKSNGKHETLELFVSKRALKKEKATKQNQPSKKSRFFTR